MGAMAVDGGCAQMPTRNPDELVWKHLKADTVGRMAITDKADFHTKVRASDGQRLPSDRRLEIRVGEPALDDRRAH
jgi:hypothetical protein